MTAHAESKTQATLLTSLFPNDTGRRLPGTAGQKRLRGEQLTFSESGGRPFLWAQRLAGIEVLPAPIAPSSAAAAIAGGPAGAGADANGPSAAEGGGPIAMDVTSAGPAADAPIKGVPAGATSGAIVVFPPASGATGAVPMDIVDAAPSAAASPDTPAQGLLQALQAALLKAPKPPVKSGGLVRKAATPLK